MNSAPIALSDEQLGELAEVAEGYASWEDMIKVLKDNVRSKRPELKYPPLELKEYPGGSVRDWLVVVVNVFGDVGIKEKNVPDRIEKNRLLARMCEAMDCTETVAKKRLATLEHGGYLREHFGCVLFPKDLLETPPGGA